MRKYRSLICGVLAVILFLKSIFLFYYANLNPSNLTIIIFISLMFNLYDRNETTKNEN